VKIQPLARGEKVVRVAGCGGSPQRTILHGQFPANREKYRENSPKWFYPTACSQKHSISGHFDAVAYFKITGNIIFNNRERAENNREKPQ
jgi:Ni,Fe-hydrogenase I small subunit